MQGAAARSPFVTQTIDFCTTLAQLVMDDEFDEDFEPTVTALVSRIDDGTSVHPVAGFKGYRT